VRVQREISQMAWQGAGQIKHRLLGLDRLAGIATVAGPYVYASLSSSWASALAADRALMLTVMISAYRVSAGSAL
jgi:hypothetical protein